MAPYTNTLLHLRVTQQKIIANAVPDCYATFQNVLWRIWCWPDLRLCFHGKEVPLWPNLTMLLLAIIKPYNRGVLGAKPNI